MADPHIKSPMDVWDKLTVIIYRTGFVIAAFSILALTWYPQPAQFATWLALLCALLGWHELALGGALVTLGGLCFKEYFCFRVPLLNLQPAFVAALWFAWVFEGGWITRILSLIVGGLLLILAVQKWRMPLHFDIGDKTKYQI